jgi:hypothetical protein
LSIAEENFMAEKSNAPTREKIGQGRFKAAALARDAVLVLTQLAEIGVDESRIGELAGLVRRSGHLIFQRADSSGQKDRDAFLSTLRTGIVAIAPKVEDEP